VEKINIMCDKLPYSNPRIDKCLITLIDNLNKSTELKTLASCCGHGIYNTTIVVKDKEGNIFEYYSNKFLGTRKRNRYYKKDKNGFYFIPEVSEVSKEKMIVSITKLLLKETIEDYCSCELIAEKIYDLIIRETEVSRTKKEREIET